MNAFIIKILSIYTNSLNKMLTIIFAFLIEIVGLSIYGILGAGLGTVVASVFDDGTRYSGNIYGDIPSTLGGIIGFTVGICIYNLG
jgi:hypothetical protein